MPFASVELPSLALGLLKSGLGARGIDADVHHLNLDFAGRVGRAEYEFIASKFPSTQDLAGEWVFSERMWGRDEARDRDYLDEVILGGSAAHGKHALFGDPGVLRDGLLACRAVVDPFFAGCLDAIDWGRYRLVGFSTMFHQQLAVLALARELKRRHPELVVVLGGANCEGVMGKTLFRLCEFIDVVVVGEGDEVFPRLVERILADEPSPALPGVLSRLGGAAATRRLGHGFGSIPPSTVIGLDSLPYPDFDDYFRQREAAGFDGEGCRVAVETSRGCWWGQKSHCTFCGLNGDSMAFRAKSAQRALDELHHLRARHGHVTRDFTVTDNIIPMQYFDEVLPRLADEGGELRLFYETKANLKREQVALCREAGVLDIQPGIESFSTPVLKLMRKGTTGLQNVQLLKWCRHYGLRVHWNYLWGFPGERPADYANQDGLVRSIFHLTPPGGWGPVRFDRFSPYFSDPEAHGIRGLRPYPSYGYVYPRWPAETLRDIAYYFVSDSAFDEALPVHRRLLETIERWTREGARSALFCIELGNRSLVLDTRPDAAVQTCVLGPVDAAALRHCDRIRSERSVLAHCAEPPLSSPPEATSARLAALLERRLLLEEDGRYLSVVLSVSDGFAPPVATFDRLMSALGPDAALPVPSTA